MKHSKYILFLLVFAGIESCKKNFLDVTDNSNLNRQSYVKDLNSMQAFMNGIYLLLSTKLEQGIEAAYPSLIADELKVSSTSRAFALHNNWSQIADGVKSSTSTSSTSMNGAWMNFYNIIRACNFVIEDIDKYASEDPIKSKSIKGQAFAIRALLHLRLVNTFAQHYSFTTDASHPGIPYITVSDITQPYARQSVAEVYSQLIADLESGISLMPERATDIRYMNGPAAKALLARIFLYKEDLNKAKEVAVSLINRYPLMKIDSGYPTDMYKLKQPDQTEVLFQITPVNQENALSQFLGLYARANHYLATADIATILKEYPTDVRNNWVTYNSDRWQVTKFPPGVAGGLGYTANTDYYIPIIRSSEVYLIAAEASAKTNDEANAKLYLDAVRKRANPTIAEVTANGTALLDSIYKERRKELCFEGLRMWDIQRWKEAVQRTDVLDGYQTFLPYPNDKAIAPIPGQDVSLMGLKQNPGYD